jgi:hypothetical protein
MEKQPEKFSKYFKKDAFYKDLIEDAVLHNMWALQECSHNKRDFEMWSDMQTTFVGVARTYLQMKKIVLGEPVTQEMSEEIVDADCEAKIALDKRMGTWDIHGEY